MENLSIHTCGSCKRVCDSNKSQFEHIRKKHDRIDVIVQIRELTAKLQHCMDNGIEFNVIEKEWSTKLTKLRELFHDKSWVFE